jgi:hypothetical protein
MILEYSRGTCAYAAHIALCEVGLSFELEAEENRT